MITQESWITACEWIEMVTFWIEWSANVGTNLTNSMKTMNKVTKIETKADEGLMNSNRLAFLWSFIQFRFESSWQRWSGSCFSFCSSVSFRVLIVGPIQYDVAKLDRKIPRTLQSGWIEFKTVVVFWFSAVIPLDLLGLSLILPHTWTNVFFSKCSWL